MPSTIRQPTKVLKDVEYDANVAILTLAGSMVYEDQLSGGDRIFPELSKRLDSEKFTVYVLTTDSGRKVWSSAATHESVTKIPSFPFERFAGRNVVPILYVLRSLLMFAYALKFVSSARRVVIIYSSSDYLPDTLAPFVLKLLTKKVRWVSRVYHNIPAPAERRGNPFVNLLSFASQRLSFLLMKQEANLTLSLNSSVSKELEVMGFDKTRLAVSGLGVDAKHIEAVASDGQKNYDGVFLGRLHPAKGIFDLLEIWAQVVQKESHAKLAIIGGGEKRITHALSSEIEHRRLKDNIDVLGFIANDIAVYRILKSSKLFLFTDHENGWGLAVCEAMACGLPVVAYDLDIFGSVYKQGYVTVSLSDTKLFAKKVLELLEDAEKRADLRACAQRQAKSLTWEAITDEFSKLLESTI